MRIKIPLHNTCVIHCITCNALCLLYLAWLNFGEAYHMHIFQNMDLYINKHWAKPYCADKV